MDGSHKITFPIILCAYDLKLRLHTLLASRTFVSANSCPKPLCVPVICGNLVLLNAKCYKKPVCDFCSHAMHTFPI